MHLTRSYGLMATTGEGNSLRAFIRDIVRLSDARATTTELDDAYAYLSELSRLDYGRALRNHFNCAEIHGLLKELRRSLPALNREVFREIDLQRLAATAATFGANVQARQFKGEEGRALRGFYVHDYTVLKRPLIVVNTANHPVSVVAAFWHEMGHHLTHSVFGNAHDHVSPYFSTNYHNHLNHPEEIVADMLTVLACYPKPAARQLFGDSRTSATRQGTESLTSKVMPYVRSVTGFDFERRLSCTDAMRQLAGVIHVAKLRAALLKEYDV
jgi:hypothetical protein